MKEIDGQLQVKPDTQLIAEINKEYTLKSRLRKRRGLILFAVNPYEWTAAQVKITSDAVYDPFTKKTRTTNRATFTLDVIYEWAINAERAVYKVKRDLMRYIIRSEQRKRENALKQA